MVASVSVTRVTKGDMRSRSDAADRQRAVPAVQRTGEVAIALELQEIREAGLPGPPRRAPRLPFVVVVRRTAVGQQRIDGGAAAEQARLFVAPVGALVAVAGRRSHGGAQRSPDVGRVEIGATGITAANRGRHGLQRDVAPGLDKGDGEARVFRQPCRKHATRRTAAEDQIIDHRPRVAVTARACP